MLRKIRKLALPHAQIVSQLHRLKKTNSAIHKKLFNSSYAIKNIRCKILKNRCFNTNSNYISNNRTCGNKEINFETAKEMIRNLNDVILLDIRSSQEYEEGHLNGAINVSMYDLKKSIRCIIPNTQTNIIVYCSSGTRSKTAQGILESMNYENVYNLKGGLSAI